jgi:hypothetical protein
MHFQAKEEKLGILSAKSAKNQKGKISTGTQPVTRSMWLLSDLSIVCCVTTMLVDFGDDPQIASLQMILRRKKIKNVLLDVVLTDGLRMNCIYESSVAG